MGSHFLATDIVCSSAISVKITNRYSESLLSSFSSCLCVFLSATICKSGWSPRHAEMHSYVKPLHIVPGASLSFLQGRHLFTSLSIKTQLCFLNKKAHSLQRMFITQQNIFKFLTLKYTSEMSKRVKTKFSFWMHCIVVKREKEGVYISWLILNAKVVYFSSDLTKEM